MSVGDEDLRAVDLVVVAILFRMGLDVLEVRARSWLGHRDRRDTVAADQLRQPLFLLFFAAIGVDIMDYDGLDAIAPTRVTGAPLLINGNCIEPDAAAEPAIFLFGAISASKSLRVLSANILCSSAVQAELFVIRDMLESILKVGVAINLTSVIFSAMAQSQGKHSVILLETAFLNRRGINFLLPSKFHQGTERAGQGNGLTLGSTRPA